MMAKDRYRYFRIEARELLDGLSRGVLELERAPDDRALVAGLDGMAERVAALEPPPPARAPAPEAPAGETLAPAAAAREQYQSVRVDVQELDALLGSALEASIQVSAVRRHLRQLDHAQGVVRALAEQLSARRGDGEAAPAAARLRPLVEELRRTLDATQRAAADHADLSELEIG